VPKALERSQLRSAELNHVDMAAALHLEVAVGRVPAYSPDAVTEYTLCLGLTRNGKIHRLCAMRKGNFTLAGPLQGKGPDAS
jgi:D-lactate dehydrogenase